MKNLLYWPAIPVKVFPVWQKRNSMDKIITAESKKGNIVEFTQAQWDNMVHTGHSGFWKVLNEEILPVHNQPVQINEIREVETIESFGGTTYLDIEYRVDYRKLLDQAGVKFNKNIKNPDKLKELYENSQKSITND